ncbi:MAG: hypothetical protein J6V77_03565 [Clostridia bacterium]|nr:hypothetical protein [Clostridia bacterium]
MAITLDELLGMNTKTRNDEQPIDRFPSYDDFARRTRSIQNDNRTSYNGFTSAPQSSGARSVEFLREHEAARPYTRPSQSEYQNYEYNLDSLRARRQAPVATTYVEPIAVEESVDTLYSYTRADKERPSDRELYDRLASSGNAVSVAKPVEREESTQKTSIFTHIKTKQSADTQKKARLNTKGKILLGVYVAVIILVAVLIIVNAGDLNNGSATTPSSSISGVVSADTNSSNIISVPEIEFNHGTHTFFIK